MICRNREPGRSGVAHGGVALVVRNNVSDFKKISVPNPGNFEILPCIGTIRGHSRKMVVVLCYLPPNYPTRRGKEALEYITNVIVQIKRKYTDPYLVVTGDFNQWGVDDSLADFPELEETHTMATRGNRCIDRVFTNFNTHVRNTVMRPPLESDDSTKKSDHLVVAVEAVLPRFEAYERLKYSYRFYTEESADSFTRWAVGHDWAEVLNATGSNSKAEAYQNTIDAAVTEHFKLITTTRKSTDPPWINARVRKRIKQRKAVYRREGRSASWKRLKTDLEKEEKVGVYG